MKITIADFDITPTMRGYRTVNNFTVNGARVIQEAGGLRADFVQYFDRRNQKTDISFSTAHEHGNIEDAALWCLQLGSNCPTRGLVEITINNGSRTYKLWITNGVIPQVSSQQTGIVTRHAFHILGGQLLDKQPI